MANEQDAVARDPDNTPALWKVTVDKWLDEYPTPQREELKKRLEVRERMGALFELMLHALLLRHGATVEVHPPDASSNSRRPDFLASFPNGQTAVFEAVTVNEPDNGPAWAELCNHINKLSTDFFIYIAPHPKFPRGSPPPPRKIKAFLERELAKLDVRTVRQKMETYQSWRPPSCAFDKNIEFHFYPKMEGQRGTTGSMPGLGGFRWAEAAQVIERAVRDKVTKYGAIDHPYVVVVGVNACSPWDYASEHGEEALFGPPSGGRGGVFVRSDGELRYTRVSGVAIGTIDWYLGKMRMTLYKNPHAQRSAAAIPWRLDRMVVDKPDRVLREGESVGAVLGLPKEWPRSSG